MLSYFPIFWTKFEENLQLTEIHSNKSHWKFTKNFYLSEPNSDSSQTFNMELSTKKVNSWKPSSIVAKSPILGVSLGCEYVLAFTCWYEKDKLYNRYVNLPLVIVRTKTGITLQD